MNRRNLLVMAGALGLVPAAALGQGSDAATLARDAYLFSLPWIEMATTRARVFKRGARPNSIYHRRNLSDHTDRSVTTPNNDTLYSLAWIDLTKGPVTLTIPPSGKRYVSAAILNMFTDNDAVLGTRLNGGAGGVFTVVGPGQSAAGDNVVRVLTPHAWILIRTLVDGPDDLAAARKVQSGFKVSGPKVERPPAYLERDAEPEAYFANARALLAADPPRAEDAAFIQRSAGLLTEGPFDRAAMAAGVAQARAIAKLASGRVAFVNGWSYPKPNLGYHGTDYGYRAIVALQGLGALPVAEAMYMKAAGDNNSGLFNGDGLYRLTLPARLPLDGFWSLSMYEATPDGQYFFADNPIDRYAIGDRTPGLKRNADGSLDLWISRTDPGGERSANWLPAPKAGPFSMTLRTYLPRAELLDGRFRFDPIVQVPA
ncbi:DUF1254 domain-containing protein [Caulobacter sp. HMWF025]|uniref:DUF1254 domain-containing protein n=3 Tax=unclassified Caulobacter TaxID=2648921 RepID=UPI000D33A3C3|nr:DUF1254 domain-containing protein [Caulobacter sp. HMWF025]PTT08648.1 phosphatidylserine decarboxylase [Caulobacter sp. HMWF025]